MDELGLLDTESGRVLEVLERCGESLPVPVANRHPCLPLSAPSLDFHKKTHIV